MGHLKSTTRFVVRRTPSSGLIGLENVRNSGFPVGFIHTLTRRNWEHLIWVTEFAARNGARLLQIHPLELTGRAGSHMAGDALEDDVLSKVYVLAFALALPCRLGDTMKVQLDLLYRDHLREEPGLVYALEPESNPVKLYHRSCWAYSYWNRMGPSCRSLTAFIAALQAVQRKKKRLAGAWPDYIMNGYPAFRDLCRLSLG